MTAPHTPTLTFYRAPLREVTHFFYGLKTQAEKLAASGRVFPSIAFGDDQSATLWAYKHSQSGPVCYRVGAEDLNALHDALLRYELFEQRDYVIPRLKALSVKNPTMDKAINNFPFSAIAHAIPESTITPLLKGFYNTKDAIAYLEAGIDQETMEVIRKAPALLDRTIRILRSCAEDKRPKEINTGALSAQRATVLADALEHLQAKFARVDVLADTLVPADKTQPTLAAALAEAVPASEHAKHVFAPFIARAETHKADHTVKAAQFCPPALDMLQRMQQQLELVRDAFGSHADIGAKEITRATERSLAQLSTLSEGTQRLYATTEANSLGDIYDKATRHGALNGADCDHLFKDDTYSTTIQKLVSGIRAHEDKAAFLYSKRFLSDDHVKAFENVRESLHSLHRLATRIHDYGLIHNDITLITLAVQMNGLLTRPISDPSKPNLGSILLQEEPHLIRLAKQHGGYAAAEHFEHGVLKEGIPARGALR